MPPPPTPEFSSIYLKFADFCGAHFHVAGHPGDAPVPGNGTVSCGEAKGLTFEGCQTLEIWEQSLSLLLAQAPPPGSPKHAEDLYRAAPLWGFPKYFNDVVKEQPRASAPARAAQFAAWSPGPDTRKADRAGGRAGGGAAGELTGV